jgi:hypothetical protein
MDRGANGGILGNDAAYPCTHEVDVTGIDNHELNALKLVDAALKITPTRPAIGIFRQYATWNTVLFNSPDNLRPTRTRLIHGQFRPRVR